MNIIEEYIKQQAWRNWEQYLLEIPIRKDDIVFDLGCSVGSVSDLLADQVRSVVGVDLNAEFIDYCLSKKKLNQHFICSDFTLVDYSALPRPNGIWSSFSLSYLQDPTSFLASLHGLLAPEGWIALVDVSKFISGNMLPGCTHFEKLRQFEQDSGTSGVYDFDFGAKMESMLNSAGFDIVHVNNNVADQELNFVGKASKEILTNWQARLERMHGIRAQFPTIYAEIAGEVLSSLASEHHGQNGSLRFIVARKNGN